MPDSVFLQSSAGASDGCTHSDFGKFCSDWIAAYMDGQGAVHECPPKCYEVLESSVKACHAAGSPYGSHLDRMAAACKQTLPTPSPTLRPTPNPTGGPSIAPTTRSPTRRPTPVPTGPPTSAPTPSHPTVTPTYYPTRRPTPSPSRSPTRSPTAPPTPAPSRRPTRSPTAPPTSAPSRRPTRSPTAPPTPAPTRHPSRAPTVRPSPTPTRPPTRSPTRNPTRNPTRSPTGVPKAPCPPVFSGSPATCDDLYHTDPIHFIGTARCQPFAARLNAMINAYVPGARASWYCSDSRTRKDGWSLLSFRAKADQTNMATMWHKAGGGAVSNVHIFNQPKGIIYFDCRGGKIHKLNQLVRDWRPSGCSAPPAKPKCTYRQVSNMNIPHVLCNRGNNIHTALRSGCSFRTFGEAQTACESARWSAACQGITKDAWGYNLRGQSSRHPAHSWKGITSWYRVCNGRCLVSVKAPAPTKAPVAPVRSASAATRALAKGRGKFDMLCDDTAGRHWYRLATGNGNFGGSKHYLSGWCSHHGAKTNWADINGDGKADLLCDDTAGRHWYKLATGNGNFGASRHWLSGWCGHGGSYTQWADINGDGKADILCDDTAGRHWVKLSHGNGHFTRGRHYMSGWCGHHGSRTNWADINGDGKADILCDDSAGRHWYRLSRGGEGHFDGGRHYKSGWCSHHGSKSQWADISGDGKSDLLCDDTRGNHWYMLSTGNGHFGGSRHFLSGWCSHGGSYTQYADINGDGKSDILCDDTAGRHWYKFSTGNGNFGGSRHYMSGWCGHGGSRTNWADIDGN